MKGDARLAFGVRGSAFGGERDRGKANGRNGEWAIVVPSCFEVEDDDDRARVGWRSLITFGYSNDVQIPHRKAVERRFFFDRESVAVVMLRFKLSCLVIEANPLCRPGFIMFGGIH